MLACFSITIDYTRNTANFEGQPRHVRCVAFSPDGKSLARESSSGMSRRGRLRYGSSNCYSSPVGADEKVYFASQSDDVTVVRVEPSWRVVCRARLGEEIFAT